MQRGPKAKLPRPTFNLPKRLSPPSHSSADRRLRPAAQKSAHDRQRDDEADIEHASKRAGVCALAQGNLSEALGFLL